MHRPVITCGPVLSKVVLVGQAPGPREGEIGRPFGWTAGRTLFQWFETIGVDEEQFRERVYIAATCRCFPGKHPGGGDRVPSREEIGNCRPWLDAEFALLEPELILPIGKLAISQFLDAKRLTDVVGKRFRQLLKVEGAAARQVDVVPLPHPSGVSTWHRTEPGKSLLEVALREVAAHPSWRALSP